MVFEFRRFGWVVKDENARLSYYKPELRKKVLKSLLYSNEYLLKYKMYFIKKYHSYSKKSAISVYRTYGMFSYIGKSVFRRFKLNRHLAKFSASAGLLVGLRKSSF